MTQHGEQRHHRTTTSSAQPPLTPSRSYLSNTSRPSTPTSRPGHQSKENMQMGFPPRTGPGSPGQMKGFGTERMDRGDVNHEFEKLLDQYQVPASVRAKMQPLDTPIKESMLRSSIHPSNLRTQSFHPSSPGQYPRPSGPNTPQLRKTRSGSSLGSPGTPLRANNSGFPESPSWRSTEMVDEDTFVMIRSGSSSTTLFPSSKRLTQDGLPMPPLLPGDSLPREAGKRDKRHSFDLASMKERAGTLGGSFGSGTKGNLFGKNKTSKGTGLLASSSTPSIGRPGSALGKKDQTRERTKSKPEEVDAPVRMGKSKEVPNAWAEWVERENTFKMDVGRVKRLRMLLRNESTDWVQEFLAAGGYEHILARLMDLLKVEWREEQHDDQLLNELLRCIKAVETAEVGRAAMRGFGTSPFTELAKLLFSEKKPGDIVARHFIVDILLSLLQIYPDTINPSRPAGRIKTISFSDQVEPKLNKMGSRSNLRASAIAQSGPQGAIPNNHPHISFFLAELLKMIPEQQVSLEDLFTQPAVNRPGSRLLCPASELPVPKPDVHDFLKKAHKDRVYKTYLEEINGVCREFFWVMCHSENGLWELAEVDLDKIKPQAPSGASGGVEFEAIGYLTSHFQLLNELGRALVAYDMTIPSVRRDEKKGEAWKFFQDMGASGLDRTLLTVRKASVDFYPQFHLELAKFVRLAIDVGYELSYPVKRSLCPPGSKYRKRDETDTGSYAAYEKAAGGGASNLLNQVNEDVARRLDWIQPVQAGNYDFQM